MESIQNKKAYFDYAIAETMETGIELSGHETRAIRAGKAALAGAVIKIYGGQLWLVGATIGPYQEKNTPPGFDPKRARRLLAHKKEIGTLAGAVQSKHLTLVPLKLYNKGGKIKLEIGLAKSRLKGDKREAIKKRETERAIRKRSEV